MSAIEVADATVDFGPLRALNAATLTVAEGSCFGIVGESGSGKTTLLRAILGLQRLNAGRIALMGTPVPRGPRNFRAQARLIQPLFQDPAQSLSPRRRISQSMDEVAEMLGEPREGMRARLSVLFDRLGIPTALVDRHPHEISGGQARRAAIARVLLFRPRVLIADEPTAGLDVSVQGDLLNLLQDLRRDMGTTLLVVSHNLAAVRLIADRVAVMHRGRIVEAGDTGSVLDAPQHDYTRRLLASWPRPSARS